MSSSEHSPRGRSLLGGAARLIPLPRHLDERGGLVALAFTDLPFRPDRSFVISGAPAGTVRGRHALRDQYQFIVCVAGAVRVTLQTETDRSSVMLERPDEGLLVNPGVWAEQHYETDGSVLLGFASGLFDPNGYLGEPGSA